MSKILLVGIDAHSKNNTACFIDQEGNIVLKSFSFPNNLSGATELEQKIVKVVQKGSFTSLKAATEEIMGSSCAISLFISPPNFFNIKKDRLNSISSGSDVINCS